MLVEMGTSSVEDEYQQHQKLSDVDSSQHHMSMAPKSPQPSNHAQFSLELCDTPPPANRLTMKDLNSAQRGYAFAREVLRPYYGGITPRYNRASASHPIDTSDGRWTDLIQETKVLQQQSDDPFFGGSFSTSSLGSEITARNSHSRVLSEDSEIEIVHYSRKQCNMPSHVNGADNQQLQASSSSLLDPKEVLVTDAGPDSSHTNHSIYGEQLVFSHAKKPSTSSQPDKKYRTIADSSIVNINKKSTRKRKRKIRDEHLRALAGKATGDETGRELARKFREDASRWWKIVVNPTGHWADP